MNSTELAKYQPTYCTPEDRPFNLSLDLPINPEMAKQIAAIACIATLVYSMPRIVMLEINGVKNMVKILFSPKRNDHILCALTSLLARTTLLTFSTAILISLSCTGVLLVTRD
jgi:hypothetical protein